MNKKTLVVSILATVLIVLASLTSVVGTNVIKSHTEKGTIASPLFAVRVQRSVDKEDSKKIHSHYLGKDSALNIFLCREKGLHNAASRALKLLGSNPILSNQILEKLETNQIFVNLLRENNISMSEFKTYLYLIKDDSLLLEEKIRKTEVKIPASVLNSIMPLGLETTDPIGCFIMALVLAVIAIVFALIISTLTIVTCLNIGGCFEKIGQWILDSLAQGLIPPGY